MRKHNYLIGYEGEGQCVYGKDNGFCDLMTLFQAKQMSKVTFTPSGRKRNETVVYKLIKVVVDKAQGKE